METLDELDVVQRLMTDRPAFHLGGAAHWDARPGTLRWIRDAVRPGSVTIETGVGASTVVFARAGARHTAISPDPREHELVREYCDRIGVNHSGVTFIAGLSDDVLPATLGRERVIDAAFIDGAHSFPFPEVDWYYITRAMKVGGRLMLDDVPIPAIAPLFRHMKLEPNWRLEGIFDNRAAAFTMTAAPLPEEWGNQPFNDRYPDLSFVGYPRRIALRADYALAGVRSAVVQRFPGLRRLRHRR